LSEQLQLPNEPSAGKVKLFYCTAFLRSKLLPRLPAYPTIQ